MEKLKTATGKQFDCDVAVTIPNPPQLFLFIHNSTIVDTAAVFSNPKETFQLWHEHEYFSNYTNLTSISPDGNMIQVVLSRG